MKSLAVLYFGVVKERIPTIYNLIEHDIILWKSNRFEHAIDFLKSIPISELNQAVGPRQFSSILKYRLGIPFFEDGSRCSSCNRDMNIYGDHAVHCAKDVGPKFRHDLVRHVLVDMC